MWAAGPDGIPATWPGGGWQVTEVDIAAAAIARARRRAEAAGMTELAAPGATALLAAFAPARRVLLPPGMSHEEVTGLSGAAWELVEAEAVTGPGVPPPVRWVRPRSTGSSARTPAESPGRSGAGQSRIGVAVPDAGRIRALLARGQVPGWLTERSGRCLD